MQADWNDRPQRTKRGLKELRPVAATLLLAAVLGSVLHAEGFFEPRSSAVSHIDISKPFAVTPVVSAPAPSTQTVGQSEPRAEIRWAHEDYDEQVNRLLAQSAATDDAEPVRQNVFNDSNYVPSGSINTVSMASMRQPAVQPRAEARQSYVTVVSETKPSCWPYKPGSIECRNFKKNMKKGHNRLCYNSAHNYTEACRRAALYNPVQ